MRYVLEHYSRDDFDGDLTNKQYDLTNNLTINRIVDDSKFLHCFFAELCIVNQTNKQNKKVMKKKVENKQEVKRITILLRTMVNGYSLEVNNEGYMYFNAQSLLEGFMVHVGLERLESMTKEEIKEMLNSLKDGSAVKKLQAEVTELKALVDDQKKQIRDLKKTIKELNEN